ncbi:hypothetical protein DVH24_042452 [Malus domestica]|uniref:Uncharacterized protein n=1 Tax=Malus domestica TaxID=3750 RepID=A0A498J4I3_MALDO|nr:hypothetical protein DVH24_042452 [Malus domestica]
MAGPMADLIFISIDKIAFCSERSIKLPSSDSDGQQLVSRVHYKVKARYKRQDTLKARAQSAKTATKVSEMVGNVNTSNALSAFDKMEERNYLYFVKKKKE